MRVLPAVLLCACVVAACRADVATAPVPVVSRTLRAAVPGDADLVVVGNAVQLNGRTVPVDAATLAQFNRAIDLQNQIDSMAAAMGPAWSARLAATTVTQIQQDRAALVALGAALRTPTTGTSVATRIASVSMAPTCADRGINLMNETASWRADLDGLRGAGIAMLTCTINSLEGANYRVDPMTGSGSLEVNECTHSRDEYAYYSAAVAWDRFRLADMAYSYTYYCGAQP